MSNSSRRYTACPIVSPDSHHRGDRARRTQWVVTTRGIRCCRVTARTGPISAPVLGIDITDVCRETVRPSLPLISPNRRAVRVRVCVSAPPSGVCSRFPHAPVGWSLSLFCSTVRRLLPDQPWFRPVLTPKPPRYIQAPDGVTPVIRDTEGSTQLGLPLQESKASSCLGCLSHTGIAPQVVSRPRTGLAFNPACRKSASPFPFYPFLLIR